MRIEPSHFDIGDVLACHKVQIHKDMLMPELHNLLGTCGAELLLDVILNYDEFCIRSVVQDKTQASYGEFQFEL